MRQIAYVFTIDRMMQRIWHSLTSVEKSASPALSHKSGPQLTASWAGEEKANESKITSVTASKRCESNFLL